MEHLSPATPPRPPAPLRDENEYEDLLSLWSDLEAGLGIVLGHPRQVAEFEPRVRQYQRWMTDLLAQDADIGLYLLFQLATNSSVGYSAAHALTCAVLCHLMSPVLPLRNDESDSLVRAALTMNLGMTRLQDELALQTDKLSPAQQDAIRAHPTQGRDMLRQLGVADALWLDVVAGHHADWQGAGTLAQLAPVHRLARILQAVDRYAAMISPRKSREGRSATESVRTIMNASHGNEIGQALVRVIGPCPPGTYARLSDGSLAVVMRRGEQPDTPQVAIIAGSDGAMLAQPRLHATATRRPGIEATLATSTLGLRLNHHRLLQLTAAG